MKKIILDPYEKEVEQELNSLLDTGRLKSTLTPSRKKQLQQAAARTLRLQHGGQRIGAGRPKKSIVAVTRSISMPLEKWKALDRKRGLLSRGKFIAEFV